MRIKSYWVRVGPNPIVGVLIKRRKFGHEYTARRIPYEDQNIDTHRGEGN